MRIRARSQNQPNGLGCHYSGAVRRVVERMQRRLHRKATVIQKRVRAFLVRCRMYRVLRGPCRGCGASWIEENRWLDGFYVERCTVCGVACDSVDGSEIFWRCAATCMIQSVARGFLARRRLHLSTVVEHVAIRDWLRDSASLI